MRNYAKKNNKKQKQTKITLLKSSSNICFGYLLESPQRGDSNKYPKHMFYEEIRTKQGLSYIQFCPLRSLKNSKFIIMATFLGTNAVVHCIHLKCLGEALLMNTHSTQAIT